MAAPPAPTTHEWAQAGPYTLKNSKRYRYNWGQQVRSMMGTAIEGPDQGVVRFRVEIDPDGKLARLETLWTTSALAEQLARKAIENMPALPPTPTGRPLIFETTISFQPFDAGGPPIYKYDCLPDPPAYGNPFVWDGKSPRCVPRSRRWKNRIRRPWQTASNSCLRTPSKPRARTTSASWINGVPANWGVDVGDCF